MPSGLGAYQLKKVWGSGHKSAGQFIASFTVINLPSTCADVDCCLKELHNQKRASNSERRLENNYPN